MTRGPRVLHLVAAALLGGAVTALAGSCVAAALPWLFRSDGVFPYSVPELLVADLAAISAGSAVFALPVALLLGVPILFVAFRRTTSPLVVATLLGGSVGPALLGGMLALSGGAPLPYGGKSVVLCVGLLGAIGAFASALALHANRGADEGRSAV